MDVVAPEVGRKNRSKALKSLISWKENEAREPSFRRFYQGFSSGKARFTPQKAPFPSANAENALSYSAASRMAP
jgi:hypothetical protein